MAFIETVIQAFIIESEIVMIKTSGSISFLKAKSSSQRLINKYAIGAVIKNAIITSFANP